ncbi:MAG: hypothetical protein LIP77_11910 [Planctomycetes bacterium]|nr:hypothetical protein [Planctomycetota bacterium]
MKRMLALGCVVTMTVGSALAIDCNPCPPAEKWVDVCETVQVQVPVTEYVEEPVEVKVTRMVPCEQEVTTYENKWTFELKCVPYMKKEVVCEEYTVNEPRTDYREETRYRTVTRVVCDYEEKTVIDKVCEEVCDPVSGRIRKVYRDECRTVTVPVKRKVCEEVPYTVKVPCKVMVPVTKTRKVVREVPSTKEVRTPKCIKVPVTRKVTVMKPMIETQTVLRKKAVCTTRTVEKQVVRKVRVPVEPGC